MGRITEHPPQDAYQFNHQLVPTEPEETTGDAIGGNDNRSHHRLLDDGGMPNLFLYSPFGYGGGPNWKRLSVVCMMAAVGMLLSAWIPWVSDGRGRAANVPELIVMISLVLLQVTAYVQAILVNPGTVTPDVNEWLIAIAPGDDVVHCDKTQYIKPARSHYDNVSKRLVLNMDHFCPWVGNTIGFHNRKFFILLLLYTSLSSMFLVCTTVGHIMSCSPHMLLMAALVSILAATTALFGAKHGHMVTRNETTIEIKYAPELQKVYDVGWYRNTKQVMGTQAWQWFLPIYGSGPAGDGIIWPTSDDKVSYYAPPIAIATPTVVHDGKFL